MNLAQLDSKNPLLSLFSRLGLIVLALGLIVALLAEDELWVLVPVTIVLGILALIYGRSLTKRK